MEIEREMLPQEREFLDGILRISPSNSKRWFEGAQNALVLWAASLLLVVLCWLVVAWLVGLVSDLNFGIKSQYAIWIVGVGAAICAAYSIVSSVKWVKAWVDDRPLLKEDLRNNKVLEEALEIVDIKRFQEPEHGGLIYFLRISDDRILVLYDEESQQLGVEDRDPFSSSFVPLHRLRIVRAPATQFLLSREFSGAPIAISKTPYLNIPPDKWPESDSWCDIPWRELESKLSS